MAKKRFSVGKYSDRVVEGSKLEQILQAALVAPPTAKNLQLQRIYVLQSEEALAKLDALPLLQYKYL